ncbi:PTS system mannitol-specific EIICBA component, partial [Clarias magur]
LVVNPQRLLQRETPAHTGHLAAKRAPDAQHATLMCRQGLQARAAKRVVAEEHPGNVLAPGVALIAHAALVVFNQYHGTESPRLNAQGG